MASRALTLLASAAALVAVTATLAADQPSDPIESRFRSTVAALSSEGLKGEVVEYRKNAADAEAVTQWEIGEGEEKVPVRMSHRLRPAPAGSADLAEISTQLVLPAEVQEQLKPFFGDQPPLTIDSKLGADGRQQHRFRIPAHEGVVEGTRIQWSGATGEMEADGNLTRVTGGMTAPLLSASAPETQERLQIVNARLSFTYHRASPDAPWLGDFQAGVDELNGAQGDDPAGAFAIAKPTLSASLEEKGGSLTAKLEARAERVAAADLVLEEPGFSWALRGIDAAAYRTLQNQLAQAAQQARTPAETDMVLNAVLLQLLPSFLARAPEIELIRLGARTPEGTTELKARVRYTGSGDLAAFAPETDLEAEASLRVPEALIQRLATTTDAAGEGGTAELEAIRESAATQTQMLVDTGLLLREDGALVSRLELKGGKLTVNGQPADGLFAPDGPFGAAIGGLGDLDAEGLPGDALDETPPDLGSEQQDIPPEQPSPGEPEPPTTTRTRLEAPPTDRQNGGSTTQAATSALPSPPATPEQPAVEALRRSAADRQGQGDYLGALQAYRQSQTAAPDPQVADRIKRLETYLKLKGIEVPPAP
jgi:uncharacterized protein YdgA (DUF945 family)